MKSIIKSGATPHKIAKELNSFYGVPAAFLHHKNAFEFLIAVILSAQTTDAIVNKVTPKLFQKYPKPKDLANAKTQDVEETIKSVNYYKTKAKNIIKTAEIIENDFKGKIPQTIEDLIKLPGVGRKVANVILSDFYKKAEGFVVDTHIKRVTFRLGWTKNKDPKKIELDIMKILPSNHWINLPKQLILIGREYCFPKNPDCKSCPLNKYCEKIF
mgnify:CR=1 FL=1